MGNVKRLGNFEDQTWGKKRLVWLGKQPIFGLYKEGFFGPDDAFMIIIIIYRT
jgi:hypothetical protein